MRLKEKVQHYWHEIYYKITQNRGVDFAMRCKEVTAKIDLGEIPEDFLGRFRFYLHLSLCKACHFYSDASKVLKNAVRRFVKTNERSINLELLNRNLLKKFSK
jgi:hypothetical protein